MKSVIFCLFFLLSLTYAQSWVNSTWTDEKFGGTLSFCFVGTSVHGLYSDRGLIQGTLAARNLITGNFYEAGASKKNCTSGTVRLTIVAGGDYFSGSYVCADSGETFEWNGQYLGTSTANADTCGVIASNGSVNGDWGSGGNYNWYICTNDATKTYVSSYKTVYGHATVNGAETGLVYADSKIISGIYSEEGTPFGTDISYIAYDGSLRVFYSPSVNNQYNYGPTILTSTEQFISETALDHCNVNLQLITFGTFGNSTFISLDTTYGGFIRICIVDNHVHGLYSEIGLIQGQLHGNKINGSFYEAGGFYTTCSTGTFEWTINIGGNGFTGTYSCEGTEAPQPWSGSFVGGENTVNADSCAIIGEGGSTAGSWTKGIQNWDICLANDTYFSSYDYLAEPFHGYETGASYLDGRIIAGVFAQETYPQTGVSISWYTYETRIDTYYWVTDTDYVVNLNDLNNPANHGNSSVFNVGQAGTSECLRNELILDAGSWTNSSWIDPATGGDFHFCFVGQKVYGSFSNGYGIFEGALLSNSSISVEFYQPGAGVLGCISGLFTANIRAGGDIFEATLQCYGISSLITFTANYVGGPNTVNDDTCPVITGRNVTGIWASTTRNNYAWSICTESSFFESSYAISTLVDGYYLGDTLHHGKVLSGIYRETGTEYGVALSYHRYDGVLVTKFWETGPDYIANPIYGNSSLVRTDKFSYRTVTTTAYCEANDDLIEQLRVWASSSWKESRYGESLFICIVDDKAYGAYSEVGIFQGNVVGNKISGNFFQGGGVLVSCSTGTFQISISQSGASFTGSYVCSDGSGTFDWNGTYLGGSNTVNPDKCAQTSNNGNLAGSWNVGDFHWDICFSSDAPGDYYSSFDLQLSGIRGYNEGRTALGNTILSGTYVDQVTPHGITLAWRKYNKQMGYFSWVTDSNYQLNFTDFQNVNKHIAGSLVNTGPASSTECIKNEYIFQNGGSLWQNSSFTDTLSGLSGSVYLCFLPNNQVHGSFSEIGLLQGFVNGRTVSGDFYRAGGPDLYCTSGTFQFTLSQDGSKFSGSKRCIEGDSYSWNEFLLSGPSLTISQKCNVINRGSTSKLAGQWNLTTPAVSFEWDICYEGNDYSSSYSRNSLEGYEYGSIYESGNIISGINVNTLIPYAISISWINHNGELGNFFWATDENYRVFASSILDRDEHYVSYLTRQVNVTVTNEECTRNSGLVANYGIWTNSTWTFAEFNNNGAPSAKLYICIINGKVHGSYGEFGILQGTLSPDGHEIRGNFYEAGRDEFDCTIGKFSLFIDGSGSFFTGFYTCADDTTEISWSETFLAGPSSVNNGLCAVIDQTGTLEGTWSGPDDLRWSICIDDGKFESSFTTNLANSLGYSKGDEHRDNRLLNGIVASQRYPHGVNLIYRAWDGSLVEYFWTTNANYTINIADYSDIFRHYRVVCTRTNDATQAECDEYSYLLPDDNVGTDSNLSSLPDASSASALLPVLCIMLISFLLNL